MLQSRSRGSDAILISEDKCTPLILLFQQINRQRGLKKSLSTRFVFNIMDDNNSHSLRRSVLFYQELLTVWI
jgi:hypothetical protein